jgi:hypothetical protein
MVVGTVQPWAIYGKQNLADAGFAAAGANNLASGCVARGRGKYLAMLALIGIVEIPDAWCESADNGAIESSPMANLYAS